VALNDAYAKAQEAKEQREAREAESDEFKIARRAVFGYGCRVSLHKWTAGGERVALPAVCLRGAYQRASERLNASKIAVLPTIIADRQ
jgi:hypothetical protein